MKFSDNGRDKLSDPKVNGSFEKQAPGRLRVESQGLLFRSCKLGRFDFLETQLSAPGSPRMVP